MRSFIYCLLFGFLSSCQTTAQNDLPVNVPQAVKDYYADGKAELSRYELVQQRYGEARKGEIVQIYVAEDFLTDKQVKNESRKKKNTTWVLKRIETRDFNTGIYDYHMMSSAFTSFDPKKHPHSLKVSCSAQEWCGTTYSQLNRKGAQYELTLHSYFEKEADQKTKIDKGITEEELYTRMRFGPEFLPKGTINLIPSQIVSRFLHLPARSYATQASLKKYTGDAFGEAELLSYTLETVKLNRKLTIYFENEFPYSIVGWTDSYESGSGNEPLVTRATRTHLIKEAYWQLNASADTVHRKKLGLD